MQFSIHKSFTYALLVNNELGTADLVQAVFCLTNKKLKSQETDALLNV